MRRLGRGKVRAWKCREREGGPGDERSESRLQAAAFDRAGRGHVGCAGNASRVNAELMRWRPMSQGRLVDEGGS